MKNFKSLFTTLIMTLSFVVAPIAHAIIEVPLSLEVNDEGSGSVSVTGILHADSDTNISSAELVLHYNPEAFDVTAEDVSLGLGMALENANPTGITVDPVTGTITMSSFTSAPDGFTDNPAGLPVFYVAFTQNPDAPNGDFTFEVTGEDSSIKDLNNVNIIDETYMAEATFTIGEVAPTTTEEPVVTEEPTTEEPTTEEVPETGIAEWLLAAILMAGIAGFSLRKLSV